MARARKIEGPKNYLVAAACLLALGLWAVKDGWWPSAAVLKKHPLRDTSGQLDHFYVFNRSLAVFSLAAAGVCGYVHRALNR